VAAQRGQAGVPLRADALDSRGGGLQRLRRQVVAPLAPRARRLDEPGLVEGVEVTAWRVTGSSAASSVAVASPRSASASTT
jgi:hypothetical protein